MYINYVIWSGGSKDMILFLVGWVALKGKGQISFGESDSAM